MSDASRPTPVPVYHRQPIRQIAALTADEFASLTGALSQTEGDLERAQLVSHVETVLAYPRSEAALLVDAIIGACTLRLLRRGSSQDIARAIATSDGISLEGVARESLIDRLSELLGLSSIGALARAVALLAEEDGVFCRGMTLSDIRPVFTDDEAPRIMGLMIRHSLKLDFHADGDTESVFVTVDEDDLESLEQVIRRARAKGAQLRSFIASSDLPLIDLGEAH